MKLRGCSKDWHGRRGVYGRLLRDIDNMNESDREAFWIELEAQNFSDDIEVILFIEG